MTPPSTPAENPPLSELSDAELLEVVVAKGGKPFQARQIAHWLYRHGARDLGACHNLPQLLLDALGKHHSLRGCKLTSRLRSVDGSSKMLVRLGDGEVIESVLIPEGRRHTLCLSTQVGCPVGCIFCASGLHGVRRNLSRGEIIEQVLLARELLPTGVKLTNIVVMGMGEPMLNLEQLLPALGRIHDPEGINLGARRITVSTGIPGTHRPLREDPACIQPRDLAPCRGRRTAAPPGPARELQGRRSDRQRQALPRYQGPRGHL